MKTRFVVLVFFSVALTVSAQPRPQPAAPEFMKGESRLIARGDLEILTYETEEDFRKLEELYDASQRSTPSPGTYTPQFFRSRMDGSVQSYALWVPKDYDPARRYPLLLQLHGISGKALAGRRHTWKGLPREQWIDEYTPVLIAQCFGRGNTFYMGMGEVDIIEVREEIQRRFSVDPLRVFIMGHSMGGRGAFTVGLHQPGRYGNILATDPAMGVRTKPQTDPNIPDWMKPQLAVQMVSNLYPNARNVNVFFKNAGSGIGKLSTQDTDAIVAEGGFSTTEAFPGLPHNFQQSFFSFAIFVPEAIHRPIERNPPEVKYYTTTLQYNRAYWMTIDRLIRHNADATVKATYDDGKPKPDYTLFNRERQPAPPTRPPSLAVATSNIEALTLRLSDAPAPKGEAMPLRIDGAEVLNGPLPATVHFSKASGAWRVVPAPDVRGKRHGLQGPIGDIFHSKFLAVYGEGDKDLAIAELNAVRNPQVRLDLHGDFPMKAASKVSPEDLRTSNLILFGTPSTNTVLRRIAPQLPRRLMETSQGAGVIFVYPNPENPERYVAVWTGRLLSILDNGLRPGFGSMLPVILLPDWVVVKDGKVAEGGHFDNDWKM